MHFRGKVCVIPVPPSSYSILVTPFVFIILKTGDIMNCFMFVINSFIFHRFILYLDCSIPCLSVRVAVSLYKYTFEFVIDL